MRVVDELLEDEDLLGAVYEAQGKRHPHSRTHGRGQTPAEVALRMLILKHVRNWSYEVLEREVRANVVYRTFCRIGTEMDRGHASDCIRPSSRSGASAPESFANDLRYVRRM